MLIRISIWTVSLLLITLGTAPSVGCDYCLLSQGVSPLETSNGIGLRLDERYTRIGKLFEEGVAVDAQGALETHFTTQLTAFYTPFSGFTLLASVPYVVRENHANIPDDHGAASLSDSEDEKQRNFPALRHGEGPLGRTTGLSDISFLGRYQFLKRHTVVSTFIIAVQAGVRFSTGKTDATNDEDELFDAHVQPGFGANAYMAGLSFSYALNRFALSGNGLFAVANEGEVAGDDYRYGNGLNYDLTARYRLAGGMVSSRDFYAVLGITGEYHATEQINGIDNRNTGGNVIFITPGLQLKLNKVILEMSLWKPISHQLDGRQLAESLKALGGITLLLQ